MRIPVVEAVEWLNSVGVPARLVATNGDVFSDGISYDSRTLARGNLFVAIVAERDGNDFVIDAVDRGASAALVSREDPACPIPQVVVADTTIALTELGRWARKKLAPQVVGRVVGITGSVGKTTTKDFVASALRARFVVGASDKSLNNDVGLPVTLLNSPDDADALVLEMGMRGFGEIARLAELAGPNIAIITRVGESHSERVGGVDGVARAKSELVQAIGSEGFALLNADDHRVVAMKSLTTATCLTFGTSEGADMRIGGIRPEGSMRTSFAFFSSWGSGRCVLPVPGAHMASNAAAALLAAAVCEVDLGDAAAALESARLSPMRMAIHQLHGVTVLDDSYNASPTSMVAALETLATLQASRRVAVLGLMAEIDEPERRHADVARRAAELGIEVVAVGTDLYGARRIDDHADVVSFVKALPADSAALFKASRVVGLDHVVRHIIG